MSHEVVDVVEHPVIVVEVAEAVGARVRRVIRAGMAWMVSTGSTAGTGSTGLRARTALLGATDSQALMDATARTA